MYNHTRPIDCIEFAGSCYMRNFIGFIVASLLITLTQGCVLKSDHEAVLAAKADVEKELTATQVTLNTTRFVRSNR